MRRRWVGVVRCGGLGLWAVLLCLVALPSLAAVVQQVSVSSSGEAGNGESQWGSISPDGTCVVFISAASNLVAGDTNGTSDYFIRDRRTNATERVSVTSSGQQVSLTGYAPVPATNGRYVTFVGSGSSFLPGADYHNTVILRDRVAGTTELLAVTPSGDLSNGEAFGPLDVSADGRYVLFNSLAADLVPGDANGDGYTTGADAFVRDRLLGTTERVGLSSSGGELAGYSGGTDMSPDGRYVVFRTLATNVGVDIEGISEVLLRDRALGTTEVVSLTDAGEAADGDCVGGLVNPDGRYVVFQSLAPNLLGAPDERGVFLRDRVLGTTERVDLTDTGEPIASWGGWPAGVSADGRYVAFGAWISTDNVQLFLRDRVAGSTTLLSSDIPPPDWESMSDDGCHVSFFAGYDIFVWDRDARFADVASVFWSFPQIEACVNAGVVQGYEDNTYHPEYAVTRDQMAVYIARALATPSGDASVPTGPESATFTDVPNTGYGTTGTDPYWAYKYIEYCVDQGVVEGYSPTEYRPTDPVTRDQMAVFVARAKGWVSIDDDMTTAPEVFPDVPAGFWSGTAVEACVEHGTVQGYDDGKYHPEWAVTRDQMAVYVARAFSLAS